jgi:hypothetical protein
MFKESKINQRLKNLEQDQPAIKKSGKAPETGKSNPF